MFANRCETVSLAKLKGMTTQSRCSDIQVEPLPGTAKREHTYVVLEHPGGWSRDILDGETFGAELTARLRAHLKGNAGLQLIRRPGRAGQTTGPRRLFLVFTEQAVVETLTVTEPEEILDLDLSGPGRNGAAPVTHPLVLVCTHGKRDVCCALKGRPLAAELVERFPGDLVWETSHTKGHRFAPSLLLMPWGYSFGRLNHQAAAALVDAALAGTYFLPGNRGCGRYEPRGQVAELAVATALVEAGEAPGFADLSVAGDVVTHADGRTWAVELKKQEVTGVVSSCGDDPKVGTSWVAEKVTAA